MCIVNRDVELSSSEPSHNVAIDSMQAALPSNPNPDERPVKKLWISYLLALPPHGLFGAHHYYLGRRRLGIVYSCTAGLFIFGWFVDLIRLFWLLKRVNGDIQQDRDDPPYLDDAYLIWFPLGLIGGHRFYLGYTKSGVLYLCTLGIVGFGWLFDACYMVLLVKDAEEELPERGMSRYLEYAPGGESQTMHHGTYRRTMNEYSHSVSTSLVQQNTVTSDTVHVLQTDSHVAPPYSSLVIPARTTGIEVLQESNMVAPHGETQPEEHSTDMSTHDTEQISVPPVAPPGYHTLPESQLTSDIDLLPPPPTYDSLYDNRTTLHI